MSGEVPKRSRLRRRPTTEDDHHIVSKPASQESPIQPQSVHNEPIADLQHEHQPLNEPSVSSRAPSMRSSPRFEPLSSTSPTSEILGRQSPTVQVPVTAINGVLENNNDRDISETHSVEGQGVDRNQSETPVPVESRSDTPMGEADPLIRETHEDINSKPKRIGFHFRRRNKGHEEVPTSEEPATSSPGQAGFGVEDNRSVRPMPRYLQHSVFDCLLQSNVAFGMGYNINKFERFGRFDDVNPGLRLEADADGLSVGITVLRLNSYGVHLVGIVKPLVKIHVVSLSTGYYIKSRSFPAVIPVTTTPCALLDATTPPSWNQELIPNAYFSDLVAEDSLLLFEIFDDKPSLRTSYHHSGGEMAEPIAKRVAWGYLLPIGTSGELNVGFSEDWKYSERRKAGYRHGRKGHEDRGGESTDPGARLDGIEEGEYEDGGSLVTGSHRTLGIAAAGSLRITTTDGGGSNTSSGRQSPIRTRSHDPEDEEITPTGGTHRFKYPWHKPSVDKCVRVQLYAYRQYDGVVGLIQRKIKGWPTIGRYSDNGESSYPDGVPEVYVQWRLQRKLPLDGAYLSVKLGPRPAETMPILLNAPRSGDSLSSPTGENSRNQTSNHDETAAGFSSQSRQPYVGRRGRLWAGAQGAPHSPTELSKLRSALLKRTRGLQEPCVVPEKLLQRIDVGGEGALSTSFSHSGHILAIAAKSIIRGIPLSTDGVVYAIILYDTDLREEVWVEDAAHHGPIYELKWTSDDRFLLSCSGDGTAKIWDMQPTAYRSSNTMGFGALTTSQVGRLNGSLDTSIKAAGARPPSLLHTLVTSPPVYIYTGVFQDQPGSPVSNVASGVPRVITGAADGKLRVWEGARMLGYVVVTSKDKDRDGGQESVDYSPHDGQINSIVIDERSKYMITGDSEGDIFAWRCDAKGWYQLLRKFKRDQTAPTTGLAALAAEHHSGGGVLSLAMHPDKHKGQMLALLRQPAQLKVISMSTYKTHSLCAGFSGYTSGTASAAGGVFNRAQFSADGRYAVAGASVKAEDGLYRLQVWDTNTGHVVRTALSDMMFPYPVRAVSWHPTQHLLAVCMVGEGAAVVLYSGDRESADKAIERMNGANNNNSVGDLQLTTGEDLNGAGLSSTTDRLRSSYDRKSGSGSNSKGQGQLQFTSGRLSPAQSLELLRPQPAGAQSRSSTGSAVATDRGSGEAGRSQLLQSDRAREMLEKIRAAKAAKLNNP